MTKTFAFAALAAFSALTIAPGASAQDSHEMAHSGPSATVVFADLNLQSDAGVELLDSRIRAAAQRVCGRAEPNALFGGPVRQCLRETIASVQQTRNTVIAAARSEDGTRLAYTSFSVQRSS
ncbi:UrcA family protein [Aurantiacibacter sediminis]|uniref:UrcA family protein n=1 Tax=Aurantiacibacter sediminis TaxID=2793064 RepID=A0ABS0N2Q2_9SPHN|nr:UrcA family protein [Aurantiacibacter sediminis]MBH5322245.1 UrcA family protein [Aurantiacibacter sediminis]